VVDGGLFTTVQDLGRRGYQRYGVPVSGAMDPFALRAANLLVGNTDDLACLEATVIGPEVVFDAAVRIAVTGGDLGPRLDGRPLRMWQSVEVPAGTCLSLSGRRQGLRAYLACAGGFDVPAVLGSLSTFTRSGIGGFEGRALRAGDEVRIGEPAASGAGRRRLLPGLVPGYGPERVVRVMVGPQADAFTDEGRATFLAAEYTVSAQSDRIGCRLQGPAIGHVAGADIVSDGTAFGAVQVSGDGQPIVLMADRGTTGGYTKIATVISADLMHVAQAAPGDRVRFRAVTFDEALDALRGLEAALASIAADDIRMVFDKPAGVVYEEEGADAFLAETSGEWAEEIARTGRQKTEYRRQKTE
jgi:biotin-dependent carboxylase-like uncharacterized protein